jgi:predicted O-methyltransferase YrrM
MNASAAPAVYPTAAPPTRILLMVWHHHETTIKQLLVERKLKAVLEIGVESGVHTRLLLQVLEPLDGHLTSIDPKIGLLLKLRLRRVRRVRLVEAPSLEALPRLQAEGARYDCAIVDGDHNWYTVFHELEGLAPMMDRRAVILLHDVDWPYARRDMYYAPERIPAEFRHPHARRGVIEGQHDLAPRGGGGKNPNLWNALHEGGPRNGVLTAVEDFVAAHPAAGWKLRLVPSFNGLGVLERGEEGNR